MFRSFVFAWLSIYTFQIPGVHRPRFEPNVRACAVVQLYAVLWTTSLSYMQKVMHRQLHVQLKLFVRTRWKFSQLIDSSRSKSNFEFIDWYQKMWSRNLSVTLFPIFSPSCGRFCFSAIARKWKTHYNFSSDLPWIFTEPICIEHYQEIIVVLSNGDVTSYLRRP
jgi:hypothetical protein